MVVMFVGKLCFGRGYFPYYSGRFFFVPARTLIGVKLLINSFGLLKIQFKTQMCLNGKTHLCFAKHFFCFAKHIYVFNLWGLFVENTFGRTLIISKMR